MSDDLRATLGASIAAAKAQTHFRRVLRGRDLLHQVLRDFFPDTEEHGSAKDAANNLSTALDGVASGERWRVVLEVLRGRGLQDSRLRDAVERCLVAWALGLGSV